MALTPAAGFHPAAAPSVSRWTRESNLATAIVGLGRVRCSNLATAIGGPRRARRGLRQVLNGSYACRGIPSRGGSERVAVDAGIQFGNRDRWARSCPLLQFGNRDRWSSPSPSRASTGFEWLLRLPRDSIPRRLRACRGGRGNPIWQPRSLGSVVSVAPIWQPRSVVLAEPVAGFDRF